MGLKENLKKNKNKISRDFIGNESAGESDKVVAIRPDISIAASPDSYDRIVAEIMELQEELKAVDDAINERRAEGAKVARRLVERVLYVRQNPKVLPRSAATGQPITFTEFLESLGMERRYVYEQINAYNFCEEYGRPDLFGHLDYKVFVLLSRIPGLNKRRAKNLLGKAGKEKWTRSAAEKLLKSEQLAVTDLDPIAAEFLKKIGTVKDKNRQAALRKQLKQILAAGVDGFSSDP